MRRIVKQLLAIAALLLAVPAPAGAASCTAPELDRALRAARTVFVGEVIEVDELGHVAEMRVIAVWKGEDLPERVVTDGRPREGADPSAARRYQVGATYLVIPHVALMPFPDDACTATQRFNPQGTLIPTIYQDAVGADRGRPPIAATAGGDASASDSMLSGPTFMAAAAALGLAVLFIGLRNSTRRRREPAGSQKSHPAPSRGSFTGIVSGITRRSGMRSVRSLRSSKPRRFRRRR